MGRTKGHELKKFYGKLGFNYEQYKYDDIAGFSHVASAIAQELCKIYGMDFSVNGITENSSNTDEYSSSLQNFLLEFSDFLREYGLPYVELIQGDISTRFTSPEHRILVLKFLCSELIVARKTGKKSQLNGKLSNRPQATADLAEHLSRACQALGLSQPPAGMNASKMFSTLFKSTSNALSSSPPNYLGKPMLLLGGLSDKQWTDICRVGQILDSEYTSRRETLIKRADCTVQSFKWLDLGKAKMEEIERVYGPLRAAMKVRPWNNVIPHLLAARDVQLLRMEKMSSGLAREFTSCPLNRVLMPGRVPDRGGRAWETEAPPPEMPAFQKRKSGGGFGGRGGGGERGRRGRGGRGVGDGGGVGGGRGGFSSNDSFGRLTDSHPQTGISFDNANTSRQIPNDIVFQAQYFGGRGGRGRKNR